jgi:predicted metalloprotease with PDZ domain
MEDKIEINFDNHKAFIECWFGRAKKTGQKSIERTIKKTYKEGKRKKLTDEEYNLVLKYTAASKLDTCIDAVTFNEEYDFFFDLENRCLRTLSEVLKKYVTVLHIHLKNMVLQMKKHKF